MIDWSARALERPVAAPAVETFKAPLFGALIAQLEEQTRYVVLDLGPARTQTIGLLSQFRCRLDIADLAQELGGLNSHTEAAERDAAAEAMLPRRHGEATDVVLCWDLLNYLERPALSALMARIAARARPGTLVHALIVYSQTHMPARPARYIPHDNGMHLETSAAAPDTPAPRYSPDDLCRCMTGYTIDRAMLLRNGMQEFVFRL